VHPQALEAFRWFSIAGNWEAQFSRWERELVIYFGALVMLVIGKRLKKRHNLQVSSSSAQLAVTRPAGGREGVPLRRVQGLD
jgi:hypothetical protein